MFNRQKIKDNTKARKQLISSSIYDILKKEKKLNWYTSILRKLLHSQYSQMKLNQDYADLIHKLY